MIGTMSLYDVYVNTWWLHVRVEARWQRRGRVVVVLASGVRVVVLWLAGWGRISRHRIYGRRDTRSGYRCCSGSRWSRRLVILRLLISRRIRHWIIGTRDDLILKILAKLFTLSLAGKAKVVHFDLQIYQKLRQVVIKFGTFLEIR